MSKTIPLIAGQFYHIYNRGNNGEDLFCEPCNYAYFFELYIRHVYPLVETFAYCLMRNHFHLLVRPRTDLTGFQNLSGLGASSGLDEPNYSQHFSNLFNAYTKALNKAYQRSGNLFERPFKRILVDSDRYLIHLLCYIHRNPQKHSFCDDFRDYPYSSYRAIVQDKNTRVMRAEVLSWFGSFKAFEEYHAQFDEQQIQHLIEDDC
ncbi:hypothetical protein QUF61_17220 [Candidatus Venteria ishoeyi]|uniref:hypothetical protein n=1 Tax=Candidatus Venteria ishoeyi TaxID=1899563 RepID=UPI0025A5197D|nr:hypothetical protein [Candidatus Venteria ishoeyi]MDM8548234.1 hypothetical protein [Candidatus Venteria ishoeyi]